MKPEFFRTHIDLLTRGHDRLMLVLSIYALPILIGLLSLLALWAWNTQYPVASPQPLAMRIIKGTATLVEPAQALEKLQEQSALHPFHDTELSQAPFWLSFAVPQGVERTPLMVEFPSRHAMEIACWDARTLAPLGQGNHQGTTGSISAVKAGFALALSPELKNSQVLCRTSAIGPARLSALKWQATDLQTSAEEFHRKSGLLDGGITVLALFVLITAMINRSILYLLFAVWLFVNMRMGAHSAGWDAQWLGNSVPQDWLLGLRPITLAVYYLLTINLFKLLFQDDLNKVGSLWLLRTVQWTCLPLLLFSILIPYELFLPLLWIATGFSSSVLVYFLVRILHKTRSRVAMWYCASLSVTLIASLYEVLAAALGIKGLIGSINFVTAALSSSLLAALAIAEHMRQEHEQRLAVQAELEHTFAAMPIGLFTLDLSGRFTSANPALRNMLGPKVLDDGCAYWQQYFDQGAWVQLHQLVHENDKNEMEIRSKPVPGLPDTQRFLVKATLAHDKIEGSLQDITEKAKATEDLHFLANHDSLTKALNRRGIEKTLNNAIMKRTEGQPLALAYLDLDRFKLINDLFGHGAGDVVLQQVCGRISSMLSHDYQFGRVGGDEFVIVFPKTPIALAAIVCQGLIDQISTQPYQVDGKAFYVRGSIGLVEVSASMQFNDAMSTADRACRQAKTDGGGLVVYEKNALAFHQHEAELKLIALLSTSTFTEGIYLEMQPIMSLTEPHAALNFEVLLRMRDASGQVVPTGQLITAAESCGCMGTIDRWVLSTTLTWLSIHRNQLKNTKFVCVNLNGSSLNDEKFLQDVYTMLEQHRSVVSLLCLEITESVALHDLENTRRFVSKVQGYGAKVALDDFGAGYTSFSYLKEFRADVLKIDGSFIVNMNKHPANIAIVEAIVNLAQNLGMKVIAEWAEDYATVETLIEVGVDYVQGFVVARSQHPDLILAAESAASFIKDPALADHVSLMGNSEPKPLPLDHLAKTRFNLH